MRHSDASCWDSAVGSLGGCHWENIGSCRSPILFFGSDFFLAGLRCVEVLLGLEQNQAEPDQADEANDDQVRPIRNDAAGIDGCADDQREGENVDGVNQEPATMGGETIYFGDSSARAIPPFHEFLVGAPI